MILSWLWSRYSLCTLYENTLGLLEHDLKLYCISFLSWVHCDLTILYTYFLRTPSVCWSMIQSYIAFIPCLELAMISQFFIYLFILRTPSVCWSKIECRIAFAPCLVLALISCFFKKLFENAPSFYAMVWTRSFRSTIYVGLHSFCSRSTEGYDQRFSKPYCICCRSTKSYDLRFSKKTFLWINPSALQFNLH